VSDDEQESDEFAAADLIHLAEFVERMAAVAQRAGMASLSIETEGLKLKFRSGVVAERTARASPSIAGDAEGTDFAPAPVEPRGHIVTAPMVGTFYHATSPSDPPLVQVGDHVEAGQLIGVIEAMKIMNEITSDRSGTVVEIIATNSTPVEYGSPLIRLGP
jgi:acetyl-CoA carboxylase biotin carboxyl carrier protein